MRPLLGTYIEVGVRAASTRATERAAHAAFDTIGLVHRHMSFHDAASDLSRLNAEPGRTIDVHPFTLQVLRLAKAAMTASGSGFDCTVGGLLVGRGALPDHGGPSPLPRGVASDIVLGRGWARLRRPVRLTLDGIAKGYAVDRAVATLRQQGAEAGWINAGGDLRVFGDMALPVQQRQLDGTIVPLGALRDAAVATSRVPLDEAPDDDFPACLVAPGTARPAPGVWTVLARSAWRADALTKVAAATPAERRAGEIARLGGCLVEPAHGARMAA